MSRTCGLILATILMISPTHGQAADEFRCDTEVFVGTEKEPVQALLTIFYTGKLVYDFQLSKDSKEGEITVYDIERGTIELLNPHREQRCTILTDDLLRFTALYRTRKAESDLFKFCIQPVFEKTFAENSLKLASSQVTYSVSCIKPKWAGAERRYSEFADWSAQLNGMRPGNLPPFPRMELNEALAANDVLPESIERTIVTRHLTGRRTETVRSHHLFNWILAGRDRQRIEEVGERLVKYKLISPDDYLGLTKKMAGK